jgi:hypothetical protein
MIALRFVSGLLGLAVLVLSRDSQAQVSPRKVTDPPPLVAAPNAGRIIQTLKADLVVQSIRIQPPNPKDGGPATAQEFGAGFLVYATIKNQGLENAFLPRGWMLARSRFSALPSSSSNLPEKDNTTLAPGASIEVLAGNNRGAQLSPAGTWTVTVKADPDNQIAESDESNNEKSVQVTVASTGSTTPPVTPADLVISDLRLEPAEATIAGNFKLVAVIKNIGGIAAAIPGGWTSISEQSGRIRADALPYQTITLAPGQTMEFRGTPERLQRGTFTWTVTVDPQASVSENKSNNSKTIQVTVK